MAGKLVGMGVAGLLVVAGGGAATPAEAGQAPTEQVAKDGPAAERAAIRLSEDGYRAARAIRLARLDIFNGQPNEARSMLKLASDALAAAEREAPRAFKGMKPRRRGNPVESDQLWVPIDGEIALSDDFVATPERERHIASANRHLKSGEHARALDELRLAEVDVTVTRLLMPIAATRARVASAERLMADGKFYEANLALKAAEDAMVTDTEVLIERPTGPRR